MITPLPFVYLRHGETDWNRERRCQGHTDIPLNEAGIAQAETARDLLSGSGLGIVTIVCSPLSRARRTAEIVNQALGLPMVILEILKESGFGAREGEISGDWHPAWQAGDTPVGAEPYVDFVARALSAINAALEHPGPVLIVGHGGVYRSMVRHGGVGAIENLPNCVPVRHDPPRDGGTVWAAIEVGASASSD